MGLSWFAAALTRADKGFYFFIRHLFTDSVGEKVSDILTVLRTCPFSCAVLLYTDLFVIKYCSSEINLWSSVFFTYMGFTWIFLPLVIDQFRDSNVKCNQNAVRMLFYRGQHMFYMSPFLLLCVGEPTPIFVMVLLWYFVSVSPLFQLSLPSPLSICVFVQATPSVIGADLPFLPALQPSIPVIINSPVDPVSCSCCCLRRRKTFIGCWFFKLGTVSVVGSTYFCSSLTCLCSSAQDSWISFLCELLQERERIFSCGKKLCGFAWAGAKKSSDYSSFTLHFCWTFSLNKRAKLDLPSLHPESCRSP